MNFEIISEVYKAKVGRKAHPHSQLLIPCNVELLQSKNSIVEYATFDLSFIFNLLIGILFNAISYNSLLSDVLCI